MGVWKGALAAPWILRFEILHTIFSKKGRFLVSRRKNKISLLLPPLEKILPTPMNAAYNARGWLKKWNHIVTQYNDKQDRKTERSSKTKRSFENWTTLRWHNCYQVSTTDTCLDLFIGSWNTAHLVCNICNSTVVSISTSNNQYPSIKSGTLWSEALAWGFSTFDNFRYNYCKITVIFRSSEILVC